MPMSANEAKAYLEARYRDAGPLAALGTLYVAFAVADVTRDNITANLAPLTNGLTRLTIGTTAADWEAAVDEAGESVIRNTGTLTGGVLTADVNGGANVGWYAIYDHATNSAAANLVRTGQLDPAKPLLSGDTPTIPPGALEIAQ
jgi:hypothetical protein